VAIEDPRVRPFEEHTERYEAWFDAHPRTFLSEVEALRPLIPAGAGLEVGVGTGRFASALGIGAGVDPSERMLERARARGVDVRVGVAEALPYPDAAFEVVLMVTTICFVDDLARSLREARRVLAPGGTLALGFIDRDSPLGRGYEARRELSPFYAAARFRGATEVIEALGRAGFEVVGIRQAIFGDPAGVDASSTARPGHGEGGFVAVSARSRGGAGDR